MCSRVCIPKKRNRFLLLVILCSWLDQVWVFPAQDWGGLGCILASAQTPYIPLSLKPQAQPAVPPLSPATASKASPGTRTLPSSYVNASRLSSYRTEQPRWKEHESRAMHVKPWLVSTCLSKQRDSVSTEITCPRGSSFHSAGSFSHYFLSRGRTVASSWQHWELNMFSELNPVSIKNLKHHSL